MSIDMYVVYNEDAKPWPDHIARVVLRRHQSLSHQAVSESSLAAMKPMLSTAKAVVVIMSIGHLEFLQSSVAACYASCKTGLVFLCGTEEDELSQQCLVGNRKVSDHFGNFSQWNIIKHDAGQSALRDAVGKLLNAEPTLPTPPPRPSGNLLGPATAVRPPPPAEPPVQNTACLLQTTARSEEPTLITVVFDTALKADTKVEIILGDDSDSMCDIVDANHVNPYTYIFTAPEHQEGKVSVKVIANKKVVAVNLVLTYSSMVSTIHDVSQIYIHLMNTMCQLIKDQTKQPQQQQRISNGSISFADLDVKLSDLFDLDKSSSAEIPARAFEQLFGLYRYDASEEKNVELPTLLHFAAKFGLKELSAKLTDLPDATNALCITNRNRQSPQDLARLHSHTELACFLQNYIELDPREFVDTVYAGYYNEAGKYADMKRPKMVNESHYMRMNGRKMQNTNSSDAGYVKAWKPTPKEEDDVYTDVIDDPLESAGSGSSVRAGSRPPSIKARQKTSPAMAPPTSPAPPTPAAHKAAVSTPAKQDVNMPREQLELIDIMNMVKDDKISMHQMELLFRKWQISHQDVGGKSFKEKQESMKKLQEQMKFARDQTASRGGATVRTLMAAVARPLPPTTGVERNSDASLSSRDSRDSAFSRASCNSGIDLDQLEEDVPVANPPLPPRRPINAANTRTQRR